MITREKYVEIFKLANKTIPEYSSAQDLLAKIRRLLNNLNFHDDMRESVETKLMLDIIDVREGGLDWL